jgi:hypothetical protein
MDYDYWCGLPDEELARQDVAAVNLACAVGLPGSEDLDAKKSLACLEQWTERARYGRSRALRTKE